MRTTLVLPIVLALLPACDGGVIPGTGDDPDATAGDDDSARPDATPGAPDATPDPGDGVVWFEWPDQQSTTDATWGDALTDIHNHLPASYGDTYWFDDAITAGHETTHGIQADLRNYHAPGDGRYNAFYVLGDRAAFVLEPDIRKADIVPEVPEVLRGNRFDLYLVGQTAWDDTPLYVFDEWTAYVNGAAVGVGQVQAGLYDDGWTDAVMGPLEFCVYAIATAKAVSEGDATYFASNTQFRAFTAWQIERAMGLFAIGRAMTDFTWQHQDDYATAMRSSPEGEALRQFARDTWGATWTQQVLGF